MFLDIAAEFELIEYIGLLFSLRKISALPKDTIHSARPYTVCPLEKVTALVLTILRAPNVSGQIRLLLVLHRLWDRIQRVRTEYREKDHGCSCTTMHRLTRVRLY